MQFLYILKHIFFVFLTAIWCDRKQFWHYHNNDGVRSELRNSIISLDSQQGNWEIVSLHNHVNNISSRESLGMEMSPNLIECKLS